MSPTVSAAPSDTCNWRQASRASALAFSSRTASASPTVSSRRLRTGRRSSALARLKAGARGAFGRRMRAWYRAHARDLPWRRTRDPYRILVSELMLQQTQVARVVPRYHEFLHVFPTLADVARSSPRRVREAWEGLGDYPRARHLHRLARS